MLRRKWHRSTEPPRAEQSRKRSIFQRGARRVRRTGPTALFRAALGYPALRLRREKHRSRPEGRRDYFVTGRLQPNVTVDQARAALNVVSRHLQDSYPASHGDVSLVALPEAESGVHPLVRSSFAGFSTALATVMGLVLLIACTNVAGLVLARAAGRRKEIGIRIALGATRARIIRHLMAESIVVWLVAGFLGTGLAAVAIRVLASSELPTDRPLFVDISMDYRVVAFSVLATLLTGIVFGMIPAFSASRADTVVSLKEGGRALGFRSPLRRALVGGQICLCTVLLIGAVLCMRSLVNAHRIDLGFEADRVAMASIDLEAQGYDEPRSAGRDRCRAGPGSHSLSVAAVTALWHRTRGSCRKRTRDWHFASDCRVRVLPARLACFENRTDVRAPERVTATGK
ncbi:MAG: FtsX-like permease family protein [Acidobacteria bacterium]|nr:MAG: FtsX-like permease family protein [Acidobacteriota bacterium]